MRRDESVQCVVTSPPYWGLRDYGVAGQLGSEPTVSEFMDKLVEVFREVKRVLKSDGTAWVNMGDSYAGRWGAQSRPDGNDVGSTLEGSSMLSARRLSGYLKTTKTGSTKRTPGLKPKDLIGVPWRLAFALQEDGWWLRSDIIWHKPNPMPESVYDRPTKSHEYIFLLSKSESYFYDGDAIREPVSESTHARLSQNLQEQIGSARANGGTRHERKMKAVGRTDDADRKLADPGSGTKNNSSFDAAMAIMPTHRNKRTVWSVPTYSYKGAHFATFPPNLIQPCILAGSRPGDTVLDPFGGSGTTGQVALELGRNAILIELNPAYCDLIRQRTNVTPSLAL